MYQDGKMGYREPATSPVQGRSGAEWDGTGFTRRHGALRSTPVEVGTNIPAVLLGAGPRAWRDRSWRASRGEGGLAWSGAEGKQCGSRAGVVHDERETGALRVYKATARRVLLRTSGLRWRAWPRPAGCRREKQKKDGTPDARCTGTPSMALTCSVQRGSRSQRDSVAKHGNHAIARLSRSGRPPGEGGRVRANGRPAKSSLALPGLRRQTLQPAEPSSCPAAGLHHRPVAARHCSLHPLHWLIWRGSRLGHLAFTGSSS